MSAQEPPLRAALHTPVGDLIINKRLRELDLHDPQVFDLGLRGWFNLLKGFISREAQADRLEKLEVARILFAVAQMALAEAVIEEKTTPNPFENAFEKSPRKNRFEDL